MSFETLTLLALGFGLGLVHALDADHVMAVSALASRRSTTRAGWLVSVWWSLGHSGCLFLVACVVFPLGLAIPSGLSHIAEALVGLSMIALGIWVAAGLLRRHGHIHFHRHDDLLPHAHWHVHEGRHEGEGHHHARAHGHGHAPVMMGALHGLAGSAPLFALIPVVAQDSLLVALAYIALFGAGVMSAMLLFGGLLGRLLQRLLEGFGSAALDVFRGATALGSAAIGALLLSRSLF